MAAEKSKMAKVFYERLSQDGDINHGAGLRSTKCSPAKNKKQRRGPYN